MPENQGLKNNDLEKYEKMSNEELEEILRLDEQACEGEELEADELLCILEVLAGRDAGCTDKKAKESWASFQQNYLPNNGENRLKFQSKKARRWPRRWVAVAASVAIVCCVAVAGSAIGWGRAYNAAVNWTKDAFWFSKTAKRVETGLTEYGEYPFETDNSGLQLLYDTVATAGITAPVVPMWLPEGYELVQISSKTIDDRTYIAAAFYKDSDAIVMSYRISEKMSNTVYEKSDGPVAEYEADGTVYYLFANNSRTTAAWLLGKAECCISSSVDTKTVHKIIDSIYRGE